MKNIVISASIIAILSSCGNNQNTATTQDASAKVNQGKKESPVCFRRLQGQKNQDTTLLKLEFEGQLVSGTFNHIPFEKDSRKGILMGSREGDVIKANWYYMQEGMEDTLEVEFKLLGAELLQKTYAYDQNTGSEVLTDTSSFAIRFEKVNCD